MAPAGAAGTSMAVRISFGRSTFSRLTFSRGVTKNFSIRTVRSRDPAEMRAVAPRATSAGAVSDGCTMYEGPPWRIA